ncbi:MAG: hypothetical protein ACREJU_17825 [Nitrospiraceae bacterium]
MTVNVKAVEGLRPGRLWLLPSPMPCAVALAAVLFLGGGVPLRVVMAEPSVPKPASKVPAPLAAQGLFKFWNFDQQQAGEAPAGFAPHTIGSGEPGSWKIEPERETPSSPNRLTQATPCQAEGCFHLLLAEGLNYDYFDVAVRIRLTEGSQGGGGMVFAMKDQNFYAAIANLQAHAVEVIRMLDGKISVLKRVSVQPWRMPWHLLRVRRNTIISKEYMEVFFDNAQVLSLEDKTLGAGQIGLVTKGEAVVAFDNLNAAPLYSQKPLSPPAAY